MGAAAQQVLPGLSRRRITELGVRQCCVPRRRHRPGPRRVRRDVLGYRHGQPDYRAVLDDPAWTWCPSARRTRCHREIALAAAEAGKPFWIEKPVGRDARRDGRVARPPPSRSWSPRSRYNYRQRPRRWRTSGSWWQPASWAGSPGSCVFLNGQRGRPARRAVLALPARARRQRVLRRPALPRRDLVAYAAGPVHRPDRRGERRLGHRATRAGRSPRDGQRHGVLPGRGRRRRAGRGRTTRHAATLVRFAGGALGRSRCPGWRRAAVPAAAGVSGTAARHLGLSSG